MNLSMTEVQEKILQIKNEAKKLGAKVELDVNNIYDHRQLCFWYGGNIGKILYGDYTILIDVRGEVIASLSTKDGEEITEAKDRHERGGFFKALHSYIKNDDELLQMSTSHPQENHADKELHFSNNNWIEFAIESKEDGLISGSMDCVLNTEDVLEAFMDIEKILKFIPEKDLIEWKIPVEWAMYGTVKIKASSIEAALEYTKEHLEDIPLPDGDYIDGSFAIGTSDEADQIDYCRMMN